MLVRFRRRIAGCETTVERGDQCLVKQEAQQVALVLNKLTYEEYNLGELAIYDFFDLILLYCIVLPPKLLQVLVDLQVHVLN